MEPNRCRILQPKCSFSSFAWCVFLIYSLPVVLGCGARGSGRLRAWRKPGWSAAAPPGASAGCRPRPAHSDTHGNTGERQAHFYLATHSYPFVPMPRASITEAQRDTRPCPPAAAQPGGECCWMPAGRLRGKQFLLTGCVIYLREVCQALKGQSCSLSPCSRLTDEEPASGGSVTRICTAECADGEHLRTSSAFLGP